MGEAEGTQEAGAETTEQVGFGKGRIEALTDGIFAFGMTLLVLGIGYPATETTPSTTALHQYLASQVPDLIHYVIAFLVLAGFWVMHHMQSHRIRTIDRTYLWINIFTLLFIALIPFTTALAGDFPNDTPAAILFEINLLIVGLLFFVQWSYATANHRLVPRTLPAEVIRHGRLLALAIPLVSVIGILIALTGVPYSTAVFLAIPAIFILHLRHHRHR